MPTNDPEFESMIARAEARTRGEIIWESHECAEHEYKDVPVCPWPDCPNGKNRDIYRTIKVRNLSSAPVASGADPHLDEYGIEAERIFIRDKQSKEWLWREVAYLPDPPKAKFMAECSEWADQLIASGANQALENVAAGYLIPPSSNIVWLGIQLMQDSYNNTIATAKEPHA